MPATSDGWDGVARAVRGLQERVLLGHRDGGGPARLAALVVGAGGASGEVETRREAPAVPRRSSMIHSAPISTTAPLPRVTDQTRPPTRSRASRTVTSTPASVRCRAADSPAKPAPITTALGDVYPEEEFRRHESPRSPCIARPDYGTHAPESRFRHRSIGLRRDGGKGDSHGTTSSRPQSHEPPSFLKRAGLTAAALPSVAAILCCLREARLPARGRRRLLPLARPDHPVTLPMWKDADRRRPARREGRHAAGLQLGRLLLQEGPEGLREVLRRQHRVDTVQQHGGGHPEDDHRPDQARRPVHGHRTRSNKLVEAQLIQPLNHELHPQPQEGRLGRLPEPVLRPAVALHRPLRHLDHAASRTAATTSPTTEVNEKGYDDPVGQRRITGRSASTTPTAT